MYNMHQSFHNMHQHIHTVTKENIIFFKIQGNLPAHKRPLGESPAANLMELHPGDDYRGPSAKHKHNSCFFKRQVGLSLGLNLGPWCQVPAPAGGGGRRRKRTRTRARAWAATRKQETGRGRGHGQRTDGGRRIDGGRRTAKRREGPSF